MSQDSLYGPDKMNVPVLAILAKSPFWQPDTEEFLHSLAPDLELHWFEGVGHFVMMEKPKEFNEMVIAFLNKKALLK
jgi:pimeloyl-ACP methyl ester carboxylesterase